MRKHKRSIMGSAGRCRACTCTLGQRAIQRWWYSTTRGTCVCCDITCRHTAVPLQHVLLGSWGQPTPALPMGRTPAARQGMAECRAVDAQHIIVQRHTGGCTTRLVWLYRGRTACNAPRVQARLAHPHAVRKLAARQVRRRRRRLPARGRAALGVRVTAPGQHAVVAVIPLQQRGAHLQTGQARPSSRAGTLPACTQGS